MGAARFLARPRLPYAIAAAIGCSISAARGSRVTFLDSSATSTWTTSALNRGLNYKSSPPSDEARSAENHSKKGDAEIVDEANDLDTYSPAFEDDDESSWAAFSRNVDVVRQGLSRIEWDVLGDKITDFILPAWARQIPSLVNKLQIEMSMEEGSLADDIWKEALDPDINPEILWNAKVRVGNDLCREELTFRQKRKEYMVPAFAKYLGLKEKDINPEDIPTIAMCGSGGGLRAMVAGTSSYLCTQEAGLFDCVTYTAGVSGSCWLQTLYFSSLGKQNHKHLLNHIKSRIGTHIAFPPPALKLVTSAPTNKFILSGFVEKLKGDPGASFGLVDAYSLMLAARLMVPKGDLDVQDHDLKLSNQRHYLEDGQNPMPIYTVVRHEIPISEQMKKSSPDTETEKEKVKEKAKKEAWFQWFELTPWEFFVEEFGAGIPTWALGRPFSNGVNKLLDTGTALPEMRQSLLLGIYGSAFCATLSHYYKEIKPALAGLAGFGGLDGLMEERKDDLIKIHPIEPATVPNFVYGMKDKLPSTCPDSVFESDHLQVMDAGMSNNLPIYPLLRPGRDVDILIAFDASADIQKENWLSVVDGYARQRGIKSWPMGTGWPKSSAKPEENAKIYEESQASSPQVAATKVAEAREQRRQGKDDGDESKRIGEQNAQKDKNEVAKNEYSQSKDTTNEKKPTGESPTTGSDRPDEATDLGACNIWVGVKEERTSSKEPPPSKRLSWDNPEDTSFRLMTPDAGLAVIYFPLLPNDKVANVHPDKTDYLSTWNFIYTPEQVDKVVELAKRNFEEGEDATKRTIRAIYERKKMSRENQEKRSIATIWRKRQREHADTFTGNH